MTNANEVLRMPRWLGPLNMYALQWFFIRLIAICETDKKTGKPLRVIRFDVMRWVVPLTGWRSNYKFVGKPWRLRAAQSRDCGL